jgi:hypothetical protein
VLALLRTPIPRKDNNIVDPEKVIFQAFLS